MVIFENGFSSIFSYTYFTQYVNYTQCTPELHLSYNCLKVSLTANYVNANRWSTGDIIKYEFKSKKRHWSIVKYQLTGIESDTNIPGFLGK